MEIENTKFENLATCKWCRDINLNLLSAPTGFPHAPNRNRLMRSAQRCRLCSLLFRKDRSRRDSLLRLKLERHGDVDPQLCLKFAHDGEPGGRKFKLAFFVFTNEG